MHKLLLTFLLLSSSAFAFDYDMAVFLGSPRISMNFVSEILKEKIDQVPGENMLDYTTATFYFAQRNGVKAAASVQVVTETGTAYYVDIFSGIQKLQDKAAVMILPLGPSTESLCRPLAEKTDIVFLLPIGASGETEDPSDKPSCAAGNILFAAGLNFKKDDLAENQNISPLTRVATPYTALTAPVDQDRSMSYSANAFGLSMIAGKMAELRALNPELKGAALVDAFLASKTTTLEKLAGKVQGGRALIDVNL